MPMKPIVLGLATLLAGMPPAMADVSSYAGQEMRAIKSLSPQEVADLLAGRGMGLAKAAELNHYPGPRHVLDLARELDLTETALRSWVRQAEVDAERGAPGVLTTAEREELVRLRRENRTLRMERDILKKATAFFARATE